MLGRGEHRVQTALDEIRQALPFRLQGIDSDNGTEFINDHLYRYGQAQGIQFTRGRPYKKDDNAHIEQKNWTHVRKLVGYLRSDTPAAVAALNALYRHELRLFQNLFLPSVKLVRKERVGARLRRQYDAPRTPLDRLQACPEVDAATVAPWVALRDQFDPFALSQAIDRKIERLVALATVPRKVVDAVVGLRVNEEEEFAGLDLSQHSENAYAFEAGYGGTGSHAEPSARREHASALSPSHP